MANQIGYDTNSKDPEKMKSRVFVAGLGTNTTRDEIIDLFASYGRIVGASLFKGFAFVQYSNSTEAELATMALHGYTYKRAMLEVKVVFDSGKPQPTAAAAPVPVPIPQKRKRDDSQPPSKKSKDNLTQDQEVKATSASKSDMSADLLVCGGCGFLTNYLEDFVNHRKESCTSKPNKEADEPETFGCFTCSNCFTTSWELLYHLRVSHEITMYKVAKN
ncbi:hypothetical protein FO519_004370 [Halicephalobus sp. NKZ332]|nr:hypothetical protein FO519_004370 [Halicephalobus sp. NKZ332]